MGEEAVGESLEATPVGSFADGNLLEPLVRRAGPDGSWVCSGCGSALRRLPGAGRPRMLCPECGALRRGQQKRRYEESRNRTRAAERTVNPLAASLVEALTSLGLTPEATAEVAEAAMARALAHVRRSRETGTPDAPPQGPDGRGLSTGGEEKPRVALSAEERERRRAQARGHLLKDDPLLVSLYNDIRQLAQAVQDAAAQPVDPRQPRRQRSGQQISEAITRVVERREEIRRFASTAARRASDASGSKQGDPQ